MINIDHEKENMPGLTIEEINDVEQFRSMRESWDTLLKESPDNNIFLTWEWLFTWWQHYGRDKKLKILLIKQSGELVGIAPLMQSKRRKWFFTIDAIENICSVSCDYSGVILKTAEPALVIFLLDYLRKNMKNSKAVVRISHIPESSHFLALLQGQYPSFSGSFRLMKRLQSSCPYIELPTTWEGYLGTLHRDSRKTLRKRIRNLEKDFAVEFEKFGGDGDLQAQLQVLFNLHQSRWQGSSIGKIFSRPETREFYVDVSKAFHENHWLNLSFLSVNGEPVSAGWGFDYNNEFLYMTCAYEPSYSPYSVGTVHLMKLMEDAIQNGRKKFDFLQGAEAYKTRYARNKTANSQIILVKRGIAGVYRLKLLQMFTKLDNISGRNLRENFQRLLQRPWRRRVSGDD